MEKATQWKNIAFESLSKMLVEISAIFPNIIGTIATLVIGWLLTKVVVKIVSKALKLAQANRLDKVINDIEIIEGKSLNFDTVKIVSKFIKWVMYIMLVIMASDIMGLKMISEQIGELLAYLPKLITALAIFTLGLILANMVKKALKSLFESMDLSGAKIISQVVFFLILVFISITALNQAGVNTDIITSNLNMIIGAFLLAFALSLGFGSQKVVGDLLRAFYAKKNYEIGQRIKFNGIQGVIESIDGITVTLKTDKEKLVVPVKDIVESQVSVQD